MIYTAMNILFLASPQNKPECSYYSKYITHYGGNCIIYENQDDFFETLLTHSFKPDLLVLDYGQFNHLILNVYNYLKNSYRCSIPAVFFNDPYLQNEDYIDYWHETLEMVYMNGNFRFENYRHSLMILANAMQSYQKEKQAAEKKALPPSGNTTAQNETMQNQNQFFCRETASRLSAASYMIYSKKKKKAPEAVSIEELAASIKKNAKTPSRNTVVCLISRIRTALRTAGSDTYDIIKSDNGYRLIKRTAI